MNSLRWLIIIAVLLSSCKKDYLSFDYTDGAIRDNDVWESDLYTRGFLNASYAGLIRSYSVDGDGALLAAASDEAVNSNPSSAINIINNGTWGALRTIDDQYGNMYNYIRRTNLFLEKSPTSAISPATDIPRLRGEAFFLRAMYHFELMKRYGAIIIANRSFAATDNLDVPKNSFQEVVAQITSDCDSAASNIVAAAVTDWGAGDKGRATKAAALALKARTLLYAASPLHNPENDVNKWRDAVMAAKAVMDLNKHSLITVAQLPNLWNFSVSATVYNKEVIFATSADNVNQIEKDNAPISFEGKARTNPTQEMVDAFEAVKRAGNATSGPILSSAPINDPGSGYLDTNPYINRDPRLAMFIIFNKAKFKTLDVDIFTGGKDNNPQNQNSTKTGYYLRKFLSESAAWESGKTASNQRRPWVLFRYAEVLLNYAEALNETLPVPDAEVYTAVNAIRSRAGMPALPAGLSKEQMREKIHNERRVELCFEGHRFFDVRRWKEGELFFNKPVTGIQITRSGIAPAFSYTYNRFQVESRIFTVKNYYYPFPQGELNKTDNLVQNAGY
ncbi:RagB/SusD family nutrient uptake outer membrane protein [Chitinophaga barathri]|uniref:RagB/SusD family nutrient uptake outer membrane protein n=1 Tax=Chitinophaga barathri TaxID=1647451 RepID=A0A3N4MGM6_9BACT|nr:RagB/SusD family nutrient uptake outer membrane protein [Chitinophaga barathri]RPD43011.1 RagB/SusD family nutrient uptake outer membrane protein [Chitinophaga barathri]